MGAYTFVGVQTFVGTQTFVGSNILDYSMPLWTLYGVLCDCQLNKCKASSLHVSVGTSYPGCVCHVTVSVGSDEQS